jgi:hypothetical protein
MTKVRTGPDCAWTGLARDAFAGREAQPGVLPPGPAPDRRGRVRRQVAHDDEQPVPVRPGSPDRPQRGVIRHRDLGPPARVRVYELTDWGRELEPVVLHLGQWGTRAPLPEGAGWGLDSLLLALQATADPAVVNGRYELRVGTDVFTVDGTSGSVRVRRGTADRPDAALATDADTLHAVALGNRPIADTVESGDLRLDGDPQAISGLTSLLQALTSSP